MNPEAGNSPGSTSPSLEELMIRYQRADAQAATMLVESLSVPLYRFFLSQLDSRQEAEDLLQETWLRLHRVRHTYRPGEPVLPWAYAIARHVRIDSYRKRRRRSLHETTVEVLPEPKPARESPPGVPDLEHLLAALPESQREVITMLKVGGLSLEEVARATSSTVGSVKQKAHRAYERMRKLLQAETAGVAGSGKQVR